MKISKIVHPSPLGSLQICCNEAAITAVTFLDEGTAAESSPKEGHPLLSQCWNQLEEYFNGNRTHFQLPLQQEGTHFQQKVWQLLQEIPFGKTLSYQTLSKRHGDVKAIRAIASANGKNNIAVIIPCHRVIGSDGSLTGYAGGLWRKQWLLDHEKKHAFGVQPLF